MKAIIFHKHGSSAELKYEDAPDPIPAGDEVVVRVKAASINHLDIWARMGIPGPTIPLPHISGCDGAGEISAIGGRVSGLSMGQKVLIHPGVSCGNCRYCRTGWDSLCPAYQVIGYQRQGTYAEFVKIPMENAIPMPQRLSFEEAAAIPLVFITAYHMLFTRANMKIDEDVLVMAAGSGVGSAAVQLARIAGARVIATAGSDEKLMLAKELGAHHTINYNTQDLSGMIKEITAGKGADVVLEHTGGKYFKECLKALAKNGRLVTCGSTGEPNVDLNIRFLFVKHVNILGSYMGSKWELLEVLKMVERGDMKAVIDKTFPLREAAKAQQYIEDRRNKGKVLLIP